MPGLNLETVTNNLAEGYKQLESETFQEASEVQNQRRTNEQFRKRWFYTANLPVYRLNGSSLEYGLSGRQAFDAIAGADIDRFTKEILTSNGHVFNLSPEQVQLLALFGDVVWAKASDLGLTREDDEWSYFPIDTLSLDGSALNEHQRRFAVKVHGSLEDKYDPKQELSDYGENMRMLSQAGIRQTRLWLPTQEHIIPYIQNGGIVARASRLIGFDGYSSFFAGGRVVDDHDGLRGVRRAEIVAEGDEKNFSEAPAVKPAEYTAEGVLNYLRQNPVESEEVAIGLLNAANTFFQSRS